MARRKPKGRGRSAGKGRSMGRGRRARSATKKPAQRSKRTTVITETERGWGPKRTIVYEEVYEEEW